MSTMYFSLNPVAVSSKSKTRKPLSNLGFTQIGSNPTASDTIELNLEEAPKSAKFIRGVGSQVMLHGASHQTGSLDMLEERGRKLLSEDEVLAVSRHIRRYEAGGHIDGLLKPLQAILDSTEKKALFTEIRGVIKPGDVATFDALTTKLDGNTYEELNDHVLGDTKNGDNKQTDLGMTTNIVISNRGGHISHNKTPCVRERPLDNIHREEKDNREKLARMAREKRQSISDELSFSADQGRKKEIVKTSSPTAKHILEIHRPKSNSKVYKALRNGEEKSLGAMSRLTPSTERTTVSSQLNRPKKELTNHLRVDQTQTEHLSLVRTSSPISSRRSSLDSIGISGVSGVGVSNREEDSRDNEDGDAVLLRTAKRLEEGSPGSEGEGDIIVQSHSDLYAEACGQSDSLVAALEILDDLDADEYAPESQHSPRSVASISTIASTRYGSYDVQSSCSGDFDSLTRHPPVFVPPPPPSDPPPQGAHSDEAWNEWVTDDVTEEVINNSSVGMSLTTPSNTSENSYSPSPSLDYFSGSQNDIAHKEYVDYQADSRQSENNKHSWSYANSSSGGTFTKKSSEPVPVVNSLRDTLRSRRKSVERPKLGLDTYMSPDELFPPGWGRSQANNEQEEIVLDSHTLETDVNHSPSDAQENATAVLEKTINESKQMDNKYSGSRTVNVNMSNNRPTSPVTREDVEAFMSKSECKGDILYRKRHSIENLLSSGPHSEDVKSVQEPSLVVLKKTRRSLGISISGGRDSRTQPEVKIKEIFPGGAAADEGTLKTGMRVLSIDGQSLANVTHTQAVDTIRRSYANKKQEDMELLVLLQ